jgi:hypothetical protein
MRLRIKQARPINLNDAISHAVELEAFNKAELKRNVTCHISSGTKPGNVSRLSTSMTLS